MAKEQKALDMQRERTGREDIASRRELEAKRLALEKDRSLLNASQEQAKVDAVEKINISDIDLNLPLA